MQPSAAQRSDGLGRAQAAQNGWMAAFLVLQMFIASAVVAPLQRVVSQISVLQIEWVVLVGRTIGGPGVGGVGATST